MRCSPILKGEPRFSSRSRRLDDYSSSTGTSLLPALTCDRYLDVQITKYKEGICPISTNAAHRSRILWKIPVAERFWWCLSRLRQPSPTAQDRNAIKTPAD